MSMRRFRRKRPQIEERPTIKKPSGLRELPQGAAAQLQRAISALNFAQSPTVEMTRRQRDNRRVLFLHFNNPQDTKAFARAIHEHINLGSFRTSGKTPKRANLATDRSGCTLVFGTYDYDVFMQNQEALSWGLKNETPPQSVTDDGAADAAASESPLVSPTDAHGPVSNVKGVSR